MMLFANPRITKSVFSEGEGEGELRANPRKRHGEVVRFWERYTRTFWGGFLELERC